MRIPVTVMIVTLALLAISAAAENLIENADFEADEPALWAGGVIQSEVVHSGNRALRVDMPEGETASGARYPELQVNQTEAETLLVSFWMRVDITTQAPGVRGGLTFHTDFAGESLLVWYGPFAFRAEESGSWVYREGRIKPRAPVTAIRPSVYLKNLEGTVYIDDLYVGPITDLPEVPRTTTPIAASGKNGRFTDVARFEVLSFTPDAHVFHLATENQTNLALTCEVDVTRPAPIYLTSGWGSQYWTLYNPGRREIAEIHTDERLDLSQTGRHEFTVPMGDFSDHAFDLAAGDYVFITDRFKSFLIYGTDHAEGEPYVDPRTGASHTYLDSVKLDMLSRTIGPSGVAAPFSLANLTSSELSVTAQRRDGLTRVIPVLTDADGVAVPLHGLALQSTAGDVTVALAEEVAPDGVPTGEYLWPADQETPAEVSVTGAVKLATPDGIREERIEATVPVTNMPPPIATPLAPLDLVAWGAGPYAMSTSEEGGPASARALIANVKAAGVSRMIVHARGSRGDHYHSDLSLSETPGSDELALLVGEGRRQGVDIYAGYILGIAQKVDLETHPEWAQLSKAGKQNGWYCYNNPDVRSFHAALIAELVTKYDITGISLDYCRPGSGCFCERCQGLFRARYDRDLLECDSYDPDWLEFRRDAITDWMRELAAATRAARADAIFSGYVWGRLAPEADRAGQDWPRWLAEGTADWLCVGQYTPSTPLYRAQCRSLKLIADKYLDGDTSRICPLMGPSYIQGAYPSYPLADATIGRHLQAAREEGMTLTGYFPTHAIRGHTDTSASHAAGD